MKKFEYLKETFELLQKLGSTRKVADFLGISRRTVQHRIKIYRDLLNTKSFEDVKVLEKFENSNLVKKLPDEEKVVNDIRSKQLKMNIDDGTVVIFSDAHLHPSRGYSIAAKALIKLVEELKPYAIIDNGDLLDFSSISRHDPLGWDDSVTIADELDIGFKFLSELKEKSPSSRCISLQGNHTDRMDKFLVKHCPQFKGLKGFKYSDQLPEGWEYSLSAMINDDTIILHQFHGGVHSAYNNVVKSGLNILTGHTHILECKPFTDYKGTRYGIQTGTLADPKENPFFDYTLGTPLNWQSGFVILTFIHGKLQQPELATVNSDNNVFFRGKNIF